MLTMPKINKEEARRRSKRQGGVGQVWNESRNVSENKRDAII
jgi:hypothetical protein